MCGGVPRRQRAGHGSAHNLTLAGSLTLKFVTWLWITTKPQADLLLGRLRPTLAGSLALDLTLNRKVGQPRKRIPQLGLTTDRIHWGHVVLSAIRIRRQGGMGDEAEQHREVLGGSVQ